MDTDLVGKIQKVQGLCGRNLDWNLCIDVPGGRQCTDTPWGQACVDLPSGKQCVDKSVKISC